MSKVDVSVASFSEAQISKSLNSFTEFSEAKIVSMVQLFGGYSGVIYHLVLDSAMEVCFKICVGYTEEEVEKNMQILHFLSLNGPREHLCYPIGSAGKSFVCSEIGFPCFIMNFIANSSPLDKVNLPLSSKTHKIAAILGALHSVQVPKDSSFKSFLEGGCCNIADHFNGNIEEKLKTNFENHNFTKFYISTKSKVCERLSLEKLLSLPSSIIHGDPFPDNFLIDRIGTVYLIDWEDTCVGPCLFDLACALCACCFQGVDICTEAVHALLNSYINVRPLDDLEKTLFFELLVISLLCNCSWRFMNFNIDHPELVEAKDSYKDLQVKVEYLLEREKDFRTSLASA